MILMTAKLLVVFKLKIKSVSDYLNITYRDGVYPNRRAMRECGHWGAPIFISDLVVLNISREYGKIHVGLFTPVLEMHYVDLRTSR